MRLPCLCCVGMCPGPRVQVAGVGRPEFVFPAGAVDPREAGAGGAHPLRLQRVQSHGTPRGNPHSQPPQALKLRGWPAGGVPGPLRCQLGPSRAGAVPQLWPCRWRTVCHGFQVDKHERVIMIDFPQMVSVSCSAGTIPLFCGCAVGVPCPYSSGGQARAGHHDRLPSNGLCLPPQRQDVRAPLLPCFRQKKGLRKKTLAVPRAGWRAFTLAPPFLSQSVVPCSLAGTLTATWSACSKFFGKR